ncbi:MAG TPA: polysaccharide biosynthesis tyrosine autokinase [Gemmatimonadaceae bacterium]|nr:polysaccharide biosynthesis tyrosine autokinase [Gemmatimonadaceae bacterium]
MSELTPSGQRMTVPSTPIPAPVLGRGYEDGAEPGLEPIDIKEVLAVLWRHFWLILLVTGLTLAFTAYRTLKEERQYRATAVIRLVDARRALAGNIDNAQAQPMGGAWTDPIASQLQVLRSRGVASAVVDSQPLGLRVDVDGFPAQLVDDVTVVEKNAPLDSIHIHFTPNDFVASGRFGRERSAYNRPIQLNGVRFLMTGPFTRDGRLTVTSQDAGIDRVLGSLSARSRERTDVVDVTYTANDPYIAQQVANAVVQTFRWVNADRARMQSRRRRIFLEEQLKTTDEALQAASDRLIAFRADKNVLGSSKDMVSASQTNLMNLDIQRGQLAANRQVYESLLEGLKPPSSDEKRRAVRALVASPGVSANPVVVGTYTQLVKYQTSRDSMAMGPAPVAPTNPDFKRLNALIDDTESSLFDAVESQITSVDAQIAALDELRKRYTQSIQTLPSTQAEEARLTEQVDAARKLADQLRDDYQRARIAEAVEAGQVEVVDLATLPYAPIGTRRRAKLLAGLIVGLLLGSGAALLLERLNTAIRRREEIEHYLQVPGLAVIPQIVGGNGPPNRLRVGRMWVPFPSRLVNGARQKSNGHSLVTLSNLRSGGAEAFRTLRTNLIFSNAVQQLRTLVVTSPSPQEGKTTTAANLAVTFAQQGLRVVLVDCDLRRARLHTVFRAPREPGFTQLLLGQKTLEEVVQPTDVEGLWLIPAGALPPNPSELLGGAQTRATLERLKKEFDGVIIDTPPVHVAADSLILGKLSDGVLLVLRAGRTDRSSAVDARQRLGNLGARVVGAVLNDPDHKVPQYGGYYYYYEYGEPEK